MVASALLSRRSRTSGLEGVSLLPYTTRSSEQSRVFEWPCFTSSRVGCSTQRCGPIPGCWAPLHGTSSLAGRDARKRIRTAALLFGIEIPRPISRQCLDPAPALLLRCPRARHTAAPKISGLGSFMLLIKDCPSPWSPKVTPGTGRRKGPTCCVSFIITPANYDPRCTATKSTPALSRRGRRGRGRYLGVLDGKAVERARQDRTDRQNRQNRQDDTQAKKKRTGKPAPQPPRPTQSQPGMGTRRETNAGRDGNRPQKPAAAPCPHRRAGAIPQLTVTDIPSHTRPASCQHAGACMDRWRVDTARSRHHIRPARPLRSLPFSPFPSLPSQQGTFSAGVRGFGRRHSTISLDHYQSVCPARLSCLSLVCLLVSLSLWWPQYPCSGLGAIIPVLPAAD
jgi:hypothetical protein